MKDIKPEPFGRCAADRCPGRCPYRDPELMTPEGRSKLKDGPQPEPGQPWPVKVVHVLIVPMTKCSWLSLLILKISLHHGWILRVKMV